MAVQNINTEEKIIFFFKKNFKDIKLLFTLFVINLIIYGQKVFFFSLATDDFSRYYTHINEKTYWFLTRVSGRWAQDLFYEYIFVDKLMILEYFHAVIGVLLFTFVGFVIAKYFRRTNLFEVFIITLLVASTPMFAHSLYFNSGMTTWISTAFGLVGFLWLSHAQLRMRFFGFILLVVAIGTYQTIIQVSMVIIIFMAIVDLLEVQSLEEIKKIFFRSLLLLSYIILAYIVSVAINEFIIHYYDLIKDGRYRKADQVFSLSLYLDRIMQMYKSTIGLFYFKSQLLTMYNLMALLSIGGTIVHILRQRIQVKIKTISLLFLMLLFLVLPVVIYLPMITGNAIPVRAHYTIGFVMAGLFIIQLLTFKGMYKMLAQLVSISIIIVSIYYINVFFDAATRQTNADITRANQIVNRVRMHPNYNNEPLDFKVIGTKSFPVTGWPSRQQALNKAWSRYGVFEHFTDLNYKKLSRKEYREVADYLIRDGKEISDYPAKGSIVIYNNKAVVFLNAKNINAEIRRSKAKN